MNPFSTATANAPCLTWIGLKWQRTFVNTEGREKSLNLLTFIGSPPSAAGRPEFPRGPAQTVLASLSPQLSIHLPCIPIIHQMHNLSQKLQKSNLGQLPIVQFIHSMHTHTIHTRSNSPSFKTSIYFINRAIPLPCIAIIHYMHYSKITKKSNLGQVLHTFHAYA